MKKINMDFKNKEKIILIILVTATFIRICLALKTPILILSDQGYDDSLLFGYAKNLISHNWLGVYSNMTLVKGISYPIFIAALYKLSIPYSLAMILLYISSIIYLCKALTGHVNTKYLYILYILMLFLPSSMTTFITQRTYRNAILPTATIFLFASYIGLFLNKDKSTKENIPWIIGASLSLCFFWFIKEDSIWVLPFILTISLLVVIYRIINKDKRIIKKSIPLTIPFISLILVSNAISAMNFHFYGIYQTSDKSSGEFSKMMSNIFSIEDKTNKNDRVWISNNMLDKAYKASPTLSKIQNSMHEYKGWTEKNGEVYGDLIIWKIRYVMAYEGQYKDAKTAIEFSKKVNKELEKAYKNKKLQKDGKIHLASQIKGYTPSELLSHTISTIGLYSDLSHYADTGLTDFKSTGTIDELNENSALFGSYTEHTKKQNYDYNSHRTKKISNIIVKTYKTLSYVINILAIISFIGYTIKMILETRKKHYKKLNLWFVTTGLLLSTIVLLLEINLFTSFFSKGLLNLFRTFYCASAFPLIALTKYLSIYMLLVLIKDFYSNKKATLK